MKHLWRRRSLIAPIAALCLIAFFGCGDDESTEPTVTTGTLKLHFDHDVDGTALEMNTAGMPYMNSSMQMYNVTSLLYFVSDFTISEGAHGKTAHQETFDVVHFRNAEDPATRTLTLTDVPAEHYTRLTFTFGLDSEDNQSDIYPHQDAEMAWPASWGGGYHYMKYEGNFMSTGSPDGAGFRAHTGRRQFDNDPNFPDDETPYEFYFTVELDVDFHIEAGGTHEQAVSMNVNSWFKGVEPDGTDYDFDAWHPGGVMIKLDAQEILQENGGQVFSAGSHGETDPGDGDGGGSGDHGHGG